MLTVTILIVILTTVEATFRKSSNVNTKVRKLKKIILVCRRKRIFCKPKMNPY